MCWQRSGPALGRRVKSSFAPLAGAGCSEAGPTAARAERTPPPANGAANGPPLMPPLPVPDEIDERGIVVADFELSRWSSPARSAVMGDRPSLPAPAVNVGQHIAVLADVRQRESRSAPAACSSVAAISIVAKRNSLPGSSFQPRGSVHVGLGSAAPCELRST